jgi:type I restriction enzyme S subunit
MANSEDGKHSAVATRYKRYPAYKDSGVEWLGAVPIHWELGRLRSTVTGCQNGVWGDDPNGQQDIACIRVADFDRNSFTVSTIEPTLRAIEPPAVSLHLLNPGDLLLEKSGGGENQPVGAVVQYIHSRKAVCSNFIARLGVASGHLARFLAYLHAALYALRVNTRHIKQSTGIQNLDSASYLKETAGLPPVAEQKAIVTFLDFESSKINALVAKNEWLIELLQEMRIATITRAVTRGLDPDTSMKDSGVVWLGQIPAHWEWTRLRRSWSVIDCRHRTATYIPEGFPLVSTTEVKPGRLSLAGPRRVDGVDFADLTSGGRRPRRGDVVYSRNASLGSAAYIDTDEPFCMGQDICLITSAADQLYLTYLLNSPVVLGQIEALSVGSTFDRINIGQIKDFLVANPPVREQIAIAAYLDRETAKIDVLIAKVREAIDRLKEFRIALISAAVTGKIDVREGAS